MMVEVSFLVFFFVQKLRTESMAVKKRLPPLPAPSSVGRARRWRPRLVVRELFDGQNRI